MLMGFNRMESPLHIVRLEAPEINGPGDLRTFICTVSGFDFPFALVTVRIPLYLPGKLKTTLGFC